MASFKILTTDKQIENFVDGFEAEIGKRLDINYIENQGEAVGMYVNGELVGGFILITKPSFRSTMFIPDVVKCKVNILNKKMAKLSEVNGFWLKKRLRSTNASILLWEELAKMILKTDIAHVLVMHDAKSVGLEKMYTKMGLKYFYKGDSLNLDHTSTHDEIMVGSVSRLKIWLILKGLHSFRSFKQSRVQPEEVSLKRA